MRITKLFGLSAVSSALAFSIVIACGGGERAISVQSNVPTNVPLGPVGLPSCGTSTALMSVPPVSLDDLFGWVPLGNMNPPGHLFPTDHQYLYINSPEDRSTIRQVTVVAPGNITITRVHRTHYSVSNTYDYALEFALCNETRGEFGHLTTLTAGLLQDVGAFDQECGSYGLGFGDAVFTNCYTKIVAVKRNAGDTIGTTGGQGTSFALDFGLRDTRRSPLVFANQERWGGSNSGLVYSVAASDYFAEPARSAIRAHVGAHNGRTRRTVEPIGGTIAYDVPGTVRGVWINPAKPTFPESPHLAFVLDPVDPSRAIMSMGLSQPGYDAGLYPYMPRADGLVNRDPSLITPDGKIYCFEFAPWPGVVLVRLETANSLKVEGRTGQTTCAAQEPWTFTSNAFVYVR